MADRGRRRLTVKERDARQLMRKSRDMLINQMEGYENPDKFPVNDVRRAVSHAYSIAARFESELDSIPEDDTFLLELEEIAERDYKEKMVRIPQKEYDTLVKRNERLSAKINRVSILNSMIRANRTLAQQMVDLEKVNELKKRTKYIDVQIHASILAAYNDMIYLALRRMGSTDQNIQEFSDQLKNLERDYPLVQMNKEDIIERLTGGPKPIEIEAKHRIIEMTATDKLREADELL